MHARTHHIVHALELDGGTKSSGHQSIIWNGVAKQNTILDVVVVSVMLMAVVFVVGMVVLLDVVAWLVLL